MKDVDFRPSWYIKILADREGSRFRVSGFVVLGCLLLVASYESVHHTQASMDQLQELHGIYQSQDGLMSELDRLELENRVWTQSAAILTDVGSGVTVSGLLAEISHLMPRQMSLREVTMARPSRVAAIDPNATSDSEKEQKETMGAFEIAGWAESGTAIGYFVSRLAQSDLFYDVVLRYQRPETVYGKDVVEFRLVCRMLDFR